MKTKIKNILNVAFIAATGLGLWSCANEAPFESVGEGVLRIETQYRSDIKVSTRTTSIDGYTDEYLNEKLVVYIEKENFGLIRKYKGMTEISDITLPFGNYVVEGWTGDSIEASFDKKFFRGYQSGIKISEGINTMALTLNIANVVIAIDPKSLTQNLNNLEIKVNHTRGQLLFTSNEINQEKRGYFMMPNADKDLQYTIIGETSDGNQFTKEGFIKDVERGHLYNMIISSNESQIEEGGALIRLEIQDIPLVEETFEIFPAPAFRGYYGIEDHDLDEQIVSLDNNFSDLRVRTLLFGDKEKSKLSLDFSDNFSNVSTIKGKDFCNDEDLISLLVQMGIEVNIELPEYKSVIQSSSKVDVIEAWLTFTSGLLNNLQPSEKPYEITITAQDDRGYVNKVILNIANKEEAVAVPPSVGSAEAPDANNDPMSILATEVQLTGYLYDIEATNYGIMYRKSGEQEYIKVPGTLVSPLTRALSQDNPYVVKITGLTPSTTYEYKSYCDDFEEKSFKTFTTESKFIIPNASMEKWGTYSAKTLLGNKTVIYPGDEGHDNTFWDSGNEGAATANLTLTDKSTTMVNSGTYCAALKSNAALGVIAAGNIFTGKYVETDGTNGVLSLGREYDGSHPSALKVWANYRPGSKMKVKSGNEEFLPEGFAQGKDHGQIYVALTTGPVEIRTNPKNRHLFDKTEEIVLAYGEKTFEGEDFGPDGSLAELIIPIYYKEDAKTKLPTHLVIVCSATKYGDFFSGCEDSVFYLDDFELVYNSIEFE